MIKNWIIRWLNSIEGNIDYIVNDKTLRATKEGTVRPSRDNPPITLRVIHADGGTIIETSHYDRKKDDNVISLYIIHSTDDMAVKISNILTVEALKR